MIGAIEWSPVFTVLATGIVTLAGVWLNNRHSAQQERLKLAADAEREGQRLRREDIAQEKAAADLTTAEDRETGAEIAEAFLDELSSFRGAKIDGSGSLQLFWRSSGDLTVRRAVGKVRDDERRSELSLVLDALSGFDDYCTVNSLNAFRWLFDSLLELGFDLGSCVQRAQVPDEELTTRLQFVRGNLRAVKEFYAELEDFESMAAARSTDES